MRISPRVAVIAVIGLVSTAYCGGKLSWPVYPGSGVHHVISSYGQYMGNADNQVHLGIDISATPGDPVMAIQDGKVWRVSNQNQGDVYWFVIVSLPGDSTKAWGYGHLVKESIWWKVGDSIKAGDTLGTIVQWPSDGFNHLHLAFYSNLTSDTLADYQTILNPCSLLMPSNDNCSPVFHQAAGNTFYYYDYYTWIPVDPSNLTGRVRISVGAHALTYNPSWQTGIYSMKYWISKNGGDIVRDTTLSVIFNFPLGDWTYSNRLVPAFFDMGKSTRFANYYYLGAMDSTGLNDKRTEDNINTLSYPDGTYVLYVQVSNFAGDIARDSTVISFRNGISSFARAKSGVLTIRGPNCGAGICLSRFMANESLQRTRLFSLDGRLLPLHGRGTAGFKWIYRINQ